MCGCSSEQEAMEFLHRAPSERLDWLVALSERLAPSDTCWKKMRRGVKERMGGSLTVPRPISHRAAAGWQRTSRTVCTHGALMVSRRKMIWVSPFCLCKLVMNPVHHRIWRQYAVFRQQLNCFKAKVQGTPCHAVSSLTQSICCILGSH